ncbi:hypothetical protein EOPP23_03255 [Endozoicomonas sp. OPT23]|uniref:hypothetical protein n=1 Tax=Endozoicomonas sp. OPT23 TaxID=2072845 RepID=UPI00129A440D|nr:hypothetical protein [Endozoicomonas sp. OPT23]MRI32016.1 hypothetical protein [Endozoicomonas sp. OPT23]
MKSIFQAASLVFLLFTELCLADGLCHLPEGSYSGKSDRIYDKTAGTVERYAVKIQLLSNGKAEGRIQRIEYISNEKGIEIPHSAERYFFNLSFNLHACDNVDSRIKSEDIDGHLKFVNINPYLGEITLLGSVFTYSDSIIGSMEWLYESAKNQLGYQIIPDIDFSKLPVRLKRDLM